MQRTIRLNTAWGALIFGLIWTCCSISIIVPNLLNREPLILLFAIPFIGIGLVITGYGLFVLYSRSRFGRPEVTLSKQTVSVGERFSVNLVHTFKRTVYVNQVTVKLIFRETATFQQGTDTKTVTHDDIYESFELPAGRYFAGQFLQDSFSMQIPADGMHTFKVRRNQLQWFIRFEASIPKMPDYVDEYELTVRPEMAS